MGWETLLQPSLGNKICVIWLILSCSFSCESSYIYCNFTYKNTLRPVYKVYSDLNFILLNTGNHNQLGVLSGRLSTLEIFRPHGVVFNVAADPCEGGPCLSSSRGDILPFPSRSETLTSKPLHAHAFYTTHPPGKSPPWGASSGCGVSERTPTLPGYYPPFPLAPRFALLLWEALSSNTVFIAHLMKSGFLVLPRPSIVFLIQDPAFYKYFIAFT